MSSSRDAVLDQEDADFAGCSDTGLGHSAAFKRKTIVETTTTCEAKKVKLIELDDHEECASTLQNLLKELKSSSNDVELTINYKGDKPLDEILGRVLEPCEEDAVVRHGQVDNKIGTSCSQPSLENHSAPPPEEQGSSSSLGLIQNGYSNEWPSDSEEDEETLQSMYEDLLKKLKRVEGYKHDWGKKTNVNNTEQFYSSGERPTEEEKESMFKEFLKSPTSSLSGDLDRAELAEAKVQNINSSSLSYQNDEDEGNFACMNGDLTIINRVSDTSDDDNCNYYDMDINKLPDEMITSSFVLDYVLREVPIKASPSEPKDETVLVSCKDISNGAEGEGCSATKSVDREHEANISQTDNDMGNENERTECNKKFDSEFTDFNSDGVEEEDSSSSVSTTLQQPNLGEKNCVVQTRRARLPKGKNSSGARNEDEAKDAASSSSTSIKPVKVVIAKLDSAEVEKYREKKIDLVNEPPGSRTSSASSSPTKFIRLENRIKEKLVNVWMAWKESKNQKTASTSGGDSLQLPTNPTVDDKMSRSPSPILESTDNNTSPALDNNIQAHNASRQELEETEQEQVEKTSPVRQPILLGSTETGVSVNPDNATPTSSASQKKSKTENDATPSEMVNLSPDKDKPSPRARGRPKRLEFYCSEMQTRLSSRNHSLASQSSAVKVIESVIYKEEKTEKSKRSGKNSGTDNQLSPQVAMEEESKKVPKKRGRKKKSETAAESSQESAKVKSETEEKVFEGCSQYSFRTSQRKSVSLASDFSVKPKLSLSKQKLDHFKVMNEEMKKTVPDMSVLLEAMAQTSKARKKMVDDPDKSVAYIVKKFPALENYVIVKAEYDRVHSTTDKMVALENALDGLLKEALQLNPNRKFGYNHSLMEQAKEMWLKNPDCDKRLQQVLGMIVFCFHFAEKDVETRLCRFLNEGETLDRSTINLLITPTLVIKRSDVFSVETESWIYVETKKYLKVPNFYEGILCIYAIYYVFNLCYDSKLTSLFEFFDMLNGNPQSTYLHSQNLLSVSP